MILHQHWTLYLVSLSTASSQGDAARCRARDELNSNSDLCQQVAGFSAAIDCLRTSGSTGGNQQEFDGHIAAMKEQLSRGVSDALERQLSAMMNRLQQQLEAQSSFTALAVSANVGQQLQQMRAAMERSMASGLSALHQQLQQIIDQNNAQVGLWIPYACLHCYITG